MASRMPRRRSIAVTAGRRPPAIASWTTVPYVVLRLRGSVRERALGLRERQPILVSPDGRVDPWLKGNVGFSAEAGDGDGGVAGDDAQVDGHRAARPGVHTAREAGRPPGGRHQQSRQVSSLSFRASFSEAAMSSDQLGADQVVGEGAAFIGGPGVGSGAGGPLLAGYRGTGRCARRP